MLKTPSFPNAFWIVAQASIEWCLNLEHLAGGDSCSAYWKLLQYSSTAAALRQVNIQVSFRLWTCAYVLLSFNSVLLHTFVTHPFIKVYLQWYVILSTWNACSSPLCWPRLTRMRSILANVPPAVRYVQNGNEHPLVYISGYQRLLLHALLKNSAFWIYNSCLTGSSNIPHNQTQPAPP